MRKIIIHNPYDDKQFEYNSKETKNYYKDYQCFFDELTEELKKKYLVTEKTYEEREHNQGRFNIKLAKQTAPEFLLMECDYVIEFEDTGDFYLVTTTDDLNGSTIDERKNPHLKKVLLSQFIKDKMVFHVKDNIEKYSPWIYFRFNTVDTEPFFQKRKTLKEYKKKMYFGGSTSYRPIIDFFDKTILYQPPTPIPLTDYYSDVIQYSVGLSIGGTGEICFRDIEYMALGIPFLRYEFLSSFYEPLVPNYHYISIPFDETLPLLNENRRDRLGGYVHAKKLEARFKEVISNKEYLDFVSNNAKKYYEDFLAPEKRAKKTLQILGL